MHVGCGRMGGVGRERRIECADMRLAGRWHAMAVAVLAEAAVLAATPTPPSAAPPAPASTAGFAVATAFALMFLRTIPAFAAIFGVIGRVGGFRRCDAFAHRLRRGTFGLLERLLLAVTAFAALTPPPPATLTAA